MALVYSSKYPGQYAIDAAYPQGKAQNISAPSAGDGSPWEKDTINDWLGFFQSLLDEAGITPSASPDEVGTSDYMDALNAIFEPIFSKNTAFNKDFGLNTTNIAEIGALLVANRIVETNALGKLITVAKAAAYNKAFGTSSGTVAQGDDSRFLTAAQAAGVAASPTAITAANPAASIADITPLLQGLTMTLIQGSVDDYLSSTPGYIDSTDVAENVAGSNGIISYSIDDAAAATSANWSSVMPLTIAAGVKKTVMEIKSFYAGGAGGAATDEDFVYGTIVVDWINSLVTGFMMHMTGAGYALQNCWRFSGSIGTGDSDFTGVNQNGSHTGHGAIPTFRTNGTSKQIKRLPMFGYYRNVGFTIYNFS